MMNVECMNKVENIYADGEFTIIDVKKTSRYEEEEYDLLDEKDFKKYIADLEREIRNSYEYRKLISYLKNTEGMDECAVLEGVTSRDNSKVRIEIHHSPLTLFDICIAVVKKRQTQRESLELEAVSLEIMWLHYVGWVGLIPLSSTVHDMVHNQYYFIPTDKPRGFYQNFINAYYDYIDPETLDCIDNAERATKEFNNSQREIFNNHKIYININGSIALPGRANMQQNIKNRINEIKNGPKVMCEIHK